MRWILPLAAVLATAPARAADPAPAEDHGVRVTYDVGALVPLGGETLLDDALLVGLTVGWELTPHLSLVATGARARTEGSWEQEPRVTQYEAGLQGQLPVALGAGAVLVLFAGAGLGGRTSDLRAVGGRTGTDATWSLAAGGRVEYRSGVLALTARDVVGTRPLRAGVSRHQLALQASFGVSF